MMRLLLADDQPEVRSALRLLLDQEAGPWSVCGEVGDAKGLLEEVGRHHCDVVLLDWELPGLHPCLGKTPTRSDGRVLSALRILHPTIVVVALSGRSEARQESSIAGADLFVSKGDPPETLLATLTRLSKKVNSGKRCR